MRYIWNLLVYSVLKFLFSFWDIRALLLPTILAVCDKIMYVSTQYNNCKYGQVTNKQTDVLQWFHDQAMEDKFRARGMLN